jgi:quercetin dioxygenase-like cupin family protein
MTNAICRIACAFALSLFVTGAHAQREQLEAKRVTTEELQWVTGPTGNQNALIAGDPKKNGMYIYRARFPAGFRNKPHYHPDDRIVTIMQGTLYVGYGEDMDDSRMKALPAGSIFTEPSKQVHYVWAKDGEVIIQVIGTGPSATVQVQPKQ